jgi:hypothetical protein
MLYKKGKNWATDLSNEWKNGTYVHKKYVRHDIQPNYSDISSIIDPLIY